MTPAAATIRAQQLMLLAVNDRWPHLNTDFAEVLAEFKGQATGDPLYVLVEQSVITRLHHLSIFRTPLEAAHYWARQECREDWNPTVLVSLDTGAVTEPDFEITWAPSDWHEPVVPHVGGRA